MNKTRALKTPLLLSPRVLLRDIKVGSRYVVDRQFNSSTIVVRVLHVVERAEEWDIYVRFEESFGRNPTQLKPGDFLELHVRDEHNEHNEFTDAMYFVPITLATDPPPLEELSEETESAWYNRARERIVAVYNKELAALDCARAKRMHYLQQAQGCRKIRNFLKRKLDSCGGPRHWSGRLPGTFDATFRDWEPNAKMPGTLESYPNRLGNDPGGCVYREAAESFKRRNI